MIQPHEINRSMLETEKLTQIFKLTKELYVSDNLKANEGNLQQAWNLINQLTSHNSGKTSNILEIK